MAACLRGYIDPGLLGQAPLIIYPLYFITSFLAKALLLALYFPLSSPNRYVRVAVYVTSTLVFGQFISGFLATIFSQCLIKPTIWNRGFWDAECINPGRYSIVSGILDVTTDIILLCLSVPIIWTFNMTRRQKVFASGVLFVGAM